MLMYHELFHKVLISVDVKIRFISVSQFNDDDNSMEFLEDQQHSESNEWTVDTKDCGKLQ